MFHMKEMIYERGYCPIKNETLRDATAVEQSAWRVQKQLLVQKDAQMDHAKNIKLTYKGMVVD